MKEKKYYVLLIKIIFSENQSGKQSGCIQLFSSQDSLFFCTWIRLPWWLRWQRVSLQCRRPRFSPWVKKIPWRGAWQPTLAFLPENPMDRGPCWATVHMVAKSQKQLKQLSTHSYVYPLFWDFLPI